MAGGTGKKGGPKSTQQSSAPKRVLEPNTQTKLPSGPKIGSKIAPKTASKPVPKPVPKTKAKTAPKTQAELTPTPKTETKLSSPLRIAPKTGAKLASPLKSAPKSPLKTAPKIEAKPTSAFPGQPLDKNIKIDIKTRLTGTYSHKASDDTAIVSTALPVEDTALRFGMSTATSKAPSAFEKGDRGYQSAGFRKKNKDISAGPDFVGFHLGKGATSPGKIEGPNWVKKTTEKVANYFKSQIRKEPAQTSSVCKLTKNVVEEVRAAQRGQTSGPQKSVTTNVPMSHGFPGISFVTNDQGTAGKWSEQLPNAFPQQEAKENMDRNTDLLCQSPSGREEQSPTNKPVDEVEPDPWPKQRTADVAEADQVDKAHSPSKMSKGLSKASDDESTDDDW